VASARQVPEVLVKLPVLQQLSACTFAAHLYNMCRMYALQPSHEGMDGLCTALLEADYAQ
jgi:hypothetical protein